MSTMTLVLNSWMQGHRVVGWQEAICLIVSGKVDVLEEYEETVSSPSISFKIPAVLRLKRVMSNYKKGVKFSRVNVMTRDGFSCCYCGAKKAMKDLNYDHVVPRIQGGKTVWRNIVTACYPCNDRKGGRTPEQAGMRLRRLPEQPKSLPMTGPILSWGEVPDLWKPYLEAHLEAYHRVAAG